MTDAEIIKALKCCGKRFANCDGCPYDNGNCITIEGKSLLMEDALDLINRQKAEIERLKGSVIINNIMEIQRIKREAKRGAKSEAIKEFVERLKIKATVVHKSYSGIHYYETDDKEIDNLVKEMTEDKEWTKS